MHYGKADYKKISNIVKAPSVCTFWSDITQETGKLGLCLDTCKLTTTVVITRQGLAVPKHQLTSRLLFLVGTNFS